MRKQTFKKLAAGAVAASMLLSSMTVFAAGEYTTKSGDNLSKIAQELYGDSTKWRDIYEANKDKIADPNLIWANQTLVIPDIDVTTEEQTAAEQTAIEEQTTTEEATEEEVVIPEVDALAVVDAVDASEFIQRVYSLMAAQDYASMNLVDGSDEAEAFVAAMESDRAIYIPNGTLTGVGAGVYKFSNSGYYFYYGDFVDGVRSGSGVEFINMGSYYNWYELTWVNDAPNGYGVKHEVHSSYTQTNSGNLVNGLWDGYVAVSLYDLEYEDTYDLSSTYANGIAVSDVTEAWRYDTDDYEVASGEGEYITAYDIHWYTEWDEEFEAYYESYPHAWYITATVGQIYGVKGFTN